ncbi:hypothetical protein BWI75_23690 [Gloeocapsopsis sp. AAB1 = 1H9]|uniref:Uncharacterized protein n=2 Tax=Gloeocapsopsis TaxID=693222 RepID=A0A6N8G5B7_9CHRO|nr:hypothetical protein [Gloeocapsopsis dulcis AAB1 = 1H9]
MKSLVHPAVIIASILGIFGLVWIALQFSVTIEIEEPLPVNTIPATRSPAPTPTTPAQDAVVPTPNPAATSSGALRMSNQTDQPVRVALLAKRSPNTYTQAPAHWDFAPLEGNEEGLILSLPEGSLTLNKGDIVVAFAQDGSGRYWGPYVVGETPTPVWNSQAQEWQLTLN